MIGVQTNAIKSLVSSAGLHVILKDSAYRIVHVLQYIEGGYTFEM